MKVKSLSRVQLSNPKDCSLPGSSIHRIFQARVLEWVTSAFSTFTVGGNANWYSHYGEQCEDSLKKLEIKLPYDPEIPLLGIHTEETRFERDTCNPMFITALFIIARTWKQPRCPSADEWIRELWCIYTMEYCCCYC